MKRYHKIQSKYHNVTWDYDPLSLVGRDDANLWQKLCVLKMNINRTSTHEPHLIRLHARLQEVSHQLLDVCCLKRIGQICTEKNIADMADAIESSLPPFGSSRRYQMQKSLLHQWSSRRTLACLDLKLPILLTVGIMYQRKAPQLLWWTPQGHESSLAQHSHFLVPDEATGSQFPHRDVRSRWPLAGTPELDFVKSFLGEKLDLLWSSSIKPQPFCNCAETWSPSHSARSHRKRIAMGIPKGTDAFGIAPGRISPTKATANSIK